MARKIDEFVSEKEERITDYSLDYPDTGCADFQRPLKYSTDTSPEEIFGVNANFLKVDTTSNSDGNVLYESRAVAKNLTGISANSTLAEKSTLADSIGGISTYTNVGFFTSFIHPDLNGTFGNSLATNGNGNLIIVGNSGFRTDGYYVGVGSTVGLSTFYGAVYLFERTNSNNFVNRGYIVGQHSKVGYGATHAAGIGSTTQGYGYTLPDYNTPVIFAGDDYGHSVAMTADGKTFVVGGPNITGESTIGIATTTNSRVTIGSSVTIEYPNVGAIWIYDYYSSGSCGSGGFSKIARFEGQKDGDLFGQSVAISADGKIVVVGSPGAGINSEGYAYVYERTDNYYSQVGILTGPISGSFGDSVSVSADGNTIVVGDTFGKDAYVFDRDEDDVNKDNECGIFELVTILNDTGGKKVCISDDGQTIITFDTNSTVYDRLGDTFTPIATLSGGGVITCSSDGKIIITASSDAYRVYNREGNNFYLNCTKSSTINSFDMSSNAKTLYRGVISDYKVYCDDQVLETFVYSDPDGNIGIGITNPTSKLHVVGDAVVTGTITATTFSGGVNYATSAGIATYATSAGIATYATSSGIATYATRSGIATYATSSGIATYATSAGIATYATSSGIATYATSAGIATSASGVTVTSDSTTTIGQPILFSNVSTGVGTVKALSTFVIKPDSGSIGIGTTNPSQLLEVYDSAPCIRLTDFSDGSYGRVRYNKTSTDAFLVLEADSANSNPTISSISFRVGGTTTTSEKVGVSSAYPLSVGIGGTIIRATSTGNVGVGSTIPGQKLDVRGSIRSSDQFLATKSPTYPTIPAYSFSLDSDTGIDSPAANTVAIITNNAERMRITSTGDVGIGTDNVLSRLHIYEVSTATTPTMRIQNASSAISASGATLLDLDYSNDSDVSTGTSSYFVRCQDADGVIGGIRAATGGSGLNYATTSDYRLKEDIVPLQNGIDRIMQLNPCEFTWKSNQLRTEGFIAHEVQEVIPTAVMGIKDAVTEDGDIDPQMIDPSKMVVVLTKALQEAIQRIEYLESIVGIGSH